MIFDKTILKHMWKASTAGLNIVVATVVGGVIGYFLDIAMEKFFGLKTSPWLLFVFTLLGIAAGFRDLFSITKTINDQPDKKDQ